VDARDTSAFTRVFDVLCAGMTAQPNAPLGGITSGKCDSPPAKSVKHFFSYNAKYFL
jgi:hypothetical protein